MATTGTQLPYVKFIPNIPVDLAFFHPTEAAEIEALRLAPGEPIRVTKTRDEKNRPYYKFEKLGAQQDGTFVVPKVGGGTPSQSIPPSASSSGNHPSIHSAPQDNTAGGGAGGRSMADSPYEHSGVSPDDVRNLLITTYIQHSKGPRG